MKINILLSQLRELAKAYERLLASSPDTINSELVADRALYKVLETLDDPALSEELDALIPNSREEILVDSDGFVADLFSRKEELVKQELNLTRSFGLKDEDIASLFKAYKKNSSSTKHFVTTSAKLKEYHLKLHTKIKEKIVHSRELPRKKKKSQKRSIGQAITSAIFGTVVICADTELPALFTYSYALGGNAIHQALRDIVGIEA